MPACRMRLLAMVMAVGVAGAVTMLPAASVVPAAAAVQPPPAGEGPVGLPALMPNGRVASPPQATAPQISTNCPAAPYGAKSAAPGGGKTVALTFDDGPGASTPSILSILASSGVPATFFNIGQNMAARPALVREEASVGYMLGNHTWDHPNMTTLSASAQGTEMDQATAEQVSLTGVQPCGFRPPGGSYNATTLSLAQQRRMTFWTWSVDTEDWKANGSASSYWVNRIIGLAEQGGTLTHPVVLMHNQPAGNPATVAALPTIISYYRSRGYTFVDLAGRTGWSSRQASQAAAQADGTIDVFWKAMDTDVAHHWYVSGWNGPQTMGPNPVVGEPSATTSSPGVVDVFWQGADARLWHQWYTPSGGWSSQQIMAAAGVIGGPPQAVAQPDGGVDVLWRGTDNHLWQMGYRPGNGWSGPRDLGGTLASGPAPAATSPGTVDVFWQGSDGHLWHAYRIGGGGSWSAAASLGIGGMAGQPAATGQASGAVDVFWKGTDGHLWRAGYAPGSGWSAGASLGGALASDPAPVASAPGTVDVFFQAADGHLWHVYRVGGGAWSAPGSLGMGILGSRPWATSQPSGAIDVFWRGSAGNHLWRAAYRPGTGWTGPANLGGDLYPVS